MPDVVPVFRHVLLTRFNTRLPGSHAPDGPWLRNRMPLFEKYCVPSVRRQTVKDFDWVVFADAATPQPWRDQLELLGHWADFRLVFLDGPFGADTAARAISELALDGAPFLITSRLDNDDAIAPHFVASVHRAFRPRRLEFLNFPLGYQLAAGRVLLRPYLASSFASLVEEATSSPWRTVHFTPHHLIGRYPVRQLWTAPAWLQVVHGHNLANEVRGIPVSASTAVALFGLREVDLAPPSIAGRVTGAARLVGRGLSTADARARAASLLPRRHRNSPPPLATAPTTDAPAAPLIIGILTCHDRRELTLRALRGWFGQQADGVHLDAVLVDDGSTDGTAAAVAAQFPGVTVVPGGGSLFWAAGMALAEAHARCRDPDTLVWLNDDVVLDDDCLATLRKVSASTAPPAVVAGALADPDTDHLTYGAFAPAGWHPLRGSLVPPAGRPVPVAAVHGNVLFVPRAAYQRLGIDGRFEHAYADFDYGLRLRRIGYPVLLTPGTIGRCSRATSSRRMPDPGLPIKERLRALNSPQGVPLRSHVRFLRRHGGPQWPVLAAAPYLKEIARGLRRHL